ncbi:hypothetical protein A3H85_03290 [Candidatus Daviesbacteria bacterium RIFCSPLOWO2_02_FULL_40_8]|uniref:YYY membrane protein n=1 Tax=Candidatus Daviesbacteria bacterium RIFCSPLOWO2_01_FULL_40_24 TaxID=1797787 RepID=A0A1F5MIS2_9BACT|nr:MAG: hypothetical protein A2780_03060 [Candidatus Daviesbacteria bacterium RIFCSPHIGHO2_01_FULL_41_45]OGE34108.1 MAG: hypothetical protein A3C32_00240 [Candidatus Daviesbacteria bacterium RIFCSPHIGHO2_02_FULL_41_14]OGE65264.1 MAG: hypothetical protein A3B49_02435 [Candidatus Daviesbacteria bacterium RIFCSPLOWO2_01_FULL_40_24]OGE66535.1 MAG: hypothetical protein A3H85_03290 [Candidatus Daviesbacteria bacterium RIFCSPLOWO2_02_FULL_40_8]
MSENIFYILQWWVVLFLLGIAFLPLTIQIFGSFFDKGYIFSKVIGLVVIGYLSWLLGSLYILPFNTFTVYLLTLICLLLNLYLLFKNKLFNQILDSKYQILLSEILFTAGLIFWAFIRSHEPSLYGLEKFMDFGFINSILRSDYFPPKDIWMTPLTINYYYFGHLSAAVLMKLSAIDSAISYNLVLATIFAICLTASFSISANLFYFFKPDSKQLMLTAGAISAFLVTLGGNLHPIYLFFQSYVPAENPVPFWQLPLKLNFGEYWYPNATRFIPNTIHEFPLYSFVVSDLHGHVFNIPFVLLFLAIIIKIFFQKRLFLFDYGVLGLLLSIFLMTNVLDGPIYLLVLSIILFVKFSRESLLKIGIIFFLTIIFSLPFWIHFTPFASGIGVLCAPQFLIDIGKIGPFLFEANHCSLSPFWMLLILWGFPLFLMSGFIKFVILKDKKIISLDLLILSLATAALILVIIPEIFYAKDIYPQHYRANTVFKFGYQAFTILGLLSGYLIVRIISSKPSYLYLLPASFLFTLVAVYPYFAISSYYNNLQSATDLDGLKYLSSTHPSDYLGIIWLRNNVQGQPIILEANGDSYTDYLRVSANTGLPTVAGWPVHEWLWRGDYSGISSRIPEVQLLYESEDLNETRQLIKKYNISYVFIGDLERQKYPKLAAGKFANLGEEVFQHGETIIYKLSSDLNSLP